MRVSLVDRGIVGVWLHSGFRGPEAEETKAFLFEMKKALKLGFGEVIVKGDCLSVT